MKKAYLIILVAIMSIYSCKAQINELNQTEFINIKFNNVTLEQIYDSEGNVNQMQTLFGSNLIIEANTTGPFLGRDFRNDEIYLNFEDDDDTGNQYDLTNIQINNSSITVTVKGIIIKLGDDVGVFGSSIVINTQNEDNSIVFTDQETGSTGLSFKIDRLTNKIIEIEFNSY